MNIDEIIPRGARDKVIIAGADACRVLVRICGGEIGAPVRELERRYLGGIMPSWNNTVDRLIPESGDLTMLNMFMDELLTIAMEMEDARADQD